MANQNIRTDLWQKFLFEKLQEFVGEITVFKTPIISHSNLILSDCYGPLDPDPLPPKFRRRARDKAWFETVKILRSWNSKHTIIITTERFV